MRLLRVVLTCAGLVGLATPLSEGAGATSLSCAQSRVAAWNGPELAKEVVSVSVNGEDLASARAAALRGFGAITLFGSTGSGHLSSTLHQLSSLNPRRVQPLVVSDEEGGGVLRLTNLVGTWPWAKVMGSTMTASEIRDVGRRVGRRLRNLGITGDLAPVADLDPSSVVPGVENADGLRSFSGSAAVASRDVAAFVTGVREAGEWAVVKHFPGLGGVSPNTDVGPARTRPWSTLTTSLLPFRAGVASGGLVMMSNATVPGLTTGPATMSAAASAALRSRLNYVGPIVSDALDAKSVSAAGWALGAASTQAIRAGEDLLIDGTPGIGVHSPVSSAEIMAAGIVAALHDGTVSLSALRRAASLDLSLSPTCAP